MRKVPNNLSPDAQPWAREVENTINSLSRRVTVAEQRNSNAFSSSNATLRGLEEQINALKESGIDLQPGKLVIEGNFQVPDRAISNSSLEYPVSVIISETEPPQDPAMGWWNPNNGSLSRWDQYLQEWVPVGVPAPWNGYYAVALGGASPPNGSSSNSIALGYTNDPAGTGSVLIGSNLTSNHNGYSSDWSVVIGYQSQGNASMVSVIGYQAQATGYSASALGHSANAAGGGSVAVGSNATAQGANSVSVGSNTVAENNNIAIGESAQSTGTSGSITIGQFATAQGANSVSVGVLSSAGSITDGEATAIGASAVATHRGSISLGYGSTSIAEDETVIHTNALNLLQPNTVTETSIVIQSPDGTPWRIKVDNSGVLSTELA